MDFYPFARKLIGSLSLLPTYNYAKVFETTKIAREEWHKGEYTFTANKVSLKKVSSKDMFILNETDKS